MRYLIAVIADTHVGDGLAELPVVLPRLLEKRNPDLILHGGDICEERVLVELNDIAPTYAVRGDHDQIPHLKTSIFLSLNGKRIVLTHGDRSPGKEDPSKRDNEHRAKLGLPRWYNGIEDDLYNRFSFYEPHVICHGHLHDPRFKQINDTSIFCPGGVYMSGRKLQIGIQPSVGFISFQEEGDLLFEIVQLPTLASFLLSEVSVKNGIEPIPA